MTAVDVVVVSYNSREHLRDCVEPLTRMDGVRAIVVDNASSDGSLDSIADLPVVRLDRTENGGFAKGCNEGWRAGSAPHVLFLNPDATIDEPSLRRLLDVLEHEPAAGAVAPKLLEEDGSLAYGLRRFPRLRSTYARALFLHRVLPRATWTDELIRDAAAYAVPASPEWVSGACVLVRREALEELDGWDDGFFLYCEDVDLCRRLWSSGRAVRYEPDAIAVHHGGASAPTSVTLPLLAASRIRYAAKHHSRLYGALERLGLALEELTRMLLSPRSLAVRRAHGRALALVLKGRA